jgi:phage terminase Nu1 subunit (DNA packaging protein)
MTKLLPQHVSSADLAVLFDVNARTIRKLETKQVLRRNAVGGFDLVDSIQGYIKHREAVVAAEHGLGDFGRARASLYLEKARIARMQREELEGKLVNVDEIIAVQSTINMHVRNRVLLIADKLAPQWAASKNAASARDLIYRECWEALDELSRAEIVPMRRGRKKKGKSDADDTDDADAA